MDDLEMRDALLGLFGEYGASVAVGLKPGGGVVIRSQDGRVDAINIGVIKPQTLPDA